MNKKAIIILTAIILLSGAMYLLVAYAVETFLSDAATRLAYQVRDEARELVRSGRTQLTFEHRPKSWPDGIDSDYRIEIIETATSPGPGHRSINITTSLNGQTKYSTSYHLNFLTVPQDLIARHRKGEPAIVTLELRDGKVLLTGLK